MTFKHLLAAGAVAAFMIAGSAANAQTFVLGNEDSVTGFVGDLFQGRFSDSLTVASDGESSFDPFNAGYDTTDGIDFTPNAGNPNWVQDANSHWNQIAAQTWVLPADLTPFGCGIENATTCEPIGRWTVHGSAWNPGAIGNFLIYDTDGVTLSDRIRTYNDGIGAHLVFSSDPSFTPEPATWAMMLMGFFGVGAMVRSRKTVAA
jgi:hypothetical protein